MQTGGEGGLQTTVERERALQVLRLLHRPDLVLQPT
jgi:hypothetical protein